MNIKAGDILVAVIVYCIGLLVGWDSVRLGERVGAGGTEDGILSPLDVHPRGRRMCHHHPAGDNGQVVGEGEPAIRAPRRP